MRYTVHQKDVLVWNSLINPLHRITYIPAFDKLCLTHNYNNVPYLTNSGPDSSLEHTDVKHD